MPVLQIDGSLSARRRDEVLTQFHQPYNNVLLMTLGTGAVGLNLTVANRVHIIEPQWNPTVESQAIGRVMRIGQQKQVYVTRYIIKNSIEEYVQNKQSRKLTMAQVGWNTEDTEVQTALDLWSLCRGSST
ncbi:hypothetical protein ASPCAL08535 [Aspergillus calidoustus]|uniref:Helicase C-terminal domain-containing protein n=1 Tax=Aspergillus calidoustus TaxID=454130 RepID=A0A0U5CQQ0_ASPCI|nr:hypothetical protein ASPCAL08535 [Aspergillus calidoustus]